MTPTRILSPKYSRRIASAAARGLSRSQARGHARAGEAPIKGPKLKTDDRLEAALKEYRRSGNRVAAAKSVNVAAERFSRFLRENIQVEGRGPSLKIIDHRPYEMAVISNGTIVRVPIGGFEQKSLNGQHLNAVKEFLSTNDIAVLAPFGGRSVIDARGVSHPLETDPNTLHRLVHAGDEQFPETYRRTF